MNKYFAIFITLLLAACGGRATGSYDAPDAGNDFDDAGSVIGDLGQTGQALTSDSGFGMELGKVGPPRCVSPWGGGGCAVPKQKTNKAIVTCAGCTFDEATAMATANTAWRNAVNANGFTITNTPAGQPQNIYIYTTQWALDPLYSLTVFWSAGDDVTTGSGKYHRWTSCEAKINYIKLGQDIAAGIYGPTCNADANCKLYVRGNLFKRAAGLCTGLGMNQVASPVPSDSRLMAKNSTLTIVPETYSPAELTMMQHFSP